MASLIYLASPYSSPNPAVRKLRYDLARLKTALLIKEGVAVFSPIVYGAHMENIIGTDYKSWQLFNDTMLAVCTEMAVLRIDGWETSSGVLYEIRTARERKLPISYLDPPEIRR